MNDNQRGGKSLFLTGGPIGRPKEEMLTDAEARQRLRRNSERFDREEAKAAPSVPDHKGGRS